MRNQLKTSAQKSQTTIKRCGKNNKLRKFGKTQIINTKAKRLSTYPSEKIVLIGVRRNFIERKIAIRLRASNFLCCCFGSALINLKLNTTKQ
jgi:hypothetical protein